MTTHTPSTSMLCELLFPPVRHRLLLLGGDARLYWLARALQQQSDPSVTLHCCQVPVPEGAPPLSQLTALPQLDGYTHILVPVPMVRQGRIAGTALEPEQLLAQLQPGQWLLGGQLPQWLVTRCSQSGIHCHDLLQSEQLAWANGALTAQAMTGLLLETLPVSLIQLPVLVTGYGRCGIPLAHRLSALGCTVTICDNQLQRLCLARALGLTSISPEQLPEALPQQQVWINTVPAPLLTDEQLSLLPPEAWFFELASPPGAINLPAAAALGLRCRRCPGLPGRWTPQSAGQLLAQEVLQLVAPSQNHLQKG